ALGQIGAELKGSLPAVQGPDVARPRPIPSLDQKEQAVYEQLGKDPLHPDQIASQTGLPAGQVTASLVSLQLKGLVKNLPGNLFVRR
ncbi:MAG: hypothetical protein QHH07_07320, partial [Sedimentisphaerales bacterium]|nr:hypothetical protein [Sedimentisphaerales bacterium]